MGKNRAIPFENIPELKAELNRAYDQIEAMKELLDEASAQMEAATAHILEQTRIHRALLDDYNVLNYELNKIRNTAPIKRRWWDRMWQG